MTITPQNQKNLNTAVGSKQGGVQVTADSKAFAGEKSVSEFEAAVNSASQDDATGKTWVLRESAGEWEQVDVLTALEDFVERAMSAEMVVVDSGNRHGDAWKYTFFPKAKLGLFVNENPY